MKYLILTLLGLSACGQTPATNQIDPAFQAIYDKFISGANANGVPLAYNQGLTIQFANLATQQNPLGETIGECDGVGYGDSTIQIDPGFWNRSDSNGQTLVVLHELGHCVLDEVHVPQLDAIMNPWFNNSITYFENPNNQDGMILTLLSEKGNGD